ncbi:hypothetical protein D3C86_2170890 [compost metagenome]
MPGVRTGLDHVLIHGVLITLSIENRGAELFGEGFSLARIELVGNNRLVDHRRRGVKVDRR